MSPSSKDHKRLAAVFVSLFFFFCLLIVRFFHVQIVEGEKWTKHANAQHHLVVVESFKRGVFYGNVAVKEGHPPIAQPLVVDVPKFHLFVDPKSIPPSCHEEICQSLMSILKLSKKDHDKLRAQLGKKSRSRKLVMWLNHGLREEIQEWWLRYARSKKLARNALFFIQDYKRSYPFGPLLGQVLHTVREEKDAFTHQAIPTGGMELIFDSYLKGKEGKRILLRSPRQPLDTDQIVSHPEDGADVYTTINPYLQAIAEEEISKAVVKAGAKGGWAVMMHPRSGEILALAQYPFFHPSDYRRFFNDPKLRETTKVMAVTDPFEPGSTMKPLTMAICFRANAELKKRGRPPIFFPEEKIPCGSGQFPGRNKPVKDITPSRFLNMELALQKSSNIYMGRMIHRVVEALGEKWYRDTLQELFGFGVKTGIELPSETPGRIPSPLRKHPNGKPEWSKPTPYSLSFGYNLLANSIQMVRAYGILANGGYDVHPTLVRKIVKKKRDGSSEILLDNTREERIQGFTRLLDEEITDRVVGALKLATKPGGTAKRADVFGYTEAGKTSTTERLVNGVYSKKDHMSTFIGFAPAKDAQFVLLIAIDQPTFTLIPGVGKNQMGGMCAAPAFRQIATRALQYLGVEPDDPYGYPVDDPRYDPEKADCAKKIEQLKALFQEWNR